MKNEKALLIIDIPDRCAVCPCLQSGTDDWFCGVVGDTIYDIGKREAFCPLKKAPIKKKTPPKKILDTMSSEWSEGYVAGWNDCVEKLPRKYRGER